jgi:hypothetical protein
LQAIDHQAFWPNYWLGEESLGLRDGWWPRSAVHVHAVVPFRPYEITSVLCESCSSVGGLIACGGKVDEVWKICVGVLVAASIAGSGTAIGDIEVSDQLEHIMAHNATNIATFLSSGSHQPGAITDVVASFPRSGTRESTTIAAVVAVIALLLMLIFVNVEIP